MNVLRTLSTPFLVSFLILSLTIAGCAGGVERVDPQEDHDLTGHWNQGDSRRVANEMIQDVLQRPWLPEFQEQHGERPRVVVGVVENLTSEHLDTSNFISDFERELTNSGRIRFVEGGDVRDMIRDERQDQARFASEETAARMGQEVGADFMLSGRVTSSIQRRGGTRIREYQVDMRLVNVETTEVVWIGDKKIAKRITRAGIGW